MSSQNKKLMKVLDGLLSEKKITPEQHDKLKKLVDSDSEAKNGQKYRAIIIGALTIIVSVFIIYLIKYDLNAVNGLFGNPALVITLTGVLSLVVSLVVFSFGWYLRDSKSQSAMDMIEIRKNLKEVKNIVGDPTFTNLLNGLPLAAKEEIIFPEPVGVLRHKEFRRALTISVALTYFAILGFSITSDPKIAKDLDNPITQAFAWVFVAVIAFYFGDKIFENYVKSKGVQVTPLEPIAIEDINISEDGKKLTVTIKNNLKSKIKITDVLVDGTKLSDFKEFDIEAEKSGKSNEMSMTKGGKTIKVEAGPVTVEKEIK